MRILFISSGNKNNDISPIIKNQGESLTNRFITVDYFLIRQKGLIGYFKSIPKIHEKISTNEYDIIHAHYSYSAFAATIAGSKPLIVSLMGSDAESDFFFRLLIRFFHRYFWHITILKSSSMNTSLRLKNINIIPNGVDLNLFKSLNKKECKIKLKWEISTSYILFASNPKRQEKNYLLAKSACEIISMSHKTVLHHLIDIPNSEIPLYINAADVILLTSHWEGSPNIIKEAMACNCPIVTTKVGDVEWVIGNTEGCFFTNYKIEDVVEKLKEALAFKKQTNGRQRIKELGLDSKTVANKIIALYKTLV